jgi:hypothetical protein
MPQRSTTDIAAAAAAAVIIYGDTFCWLFFVDNVKSSLTLCHCAAGFSSHTTHLLDCLLSLRTLRRLIVR